MLEKAGVIVTTTDNSGKQVKIVMNPNAQGDQSDKLERQADKLLESNNKNQNLEEGTDEEENDIEEPINTKKPEAGGFFRF
jgi:hypothetical protein